MRVPKMRDETQSFPVGEPAALHKKTRQSSFEHRSASLVENASHKFSNVENHGKLSFSLCFIILET